MSFESNDVRDNSLPCVPAGRCSFGAGQHQNGAAEDQPLHCLGPALCVGMGQGFVVQVAARELVDGPRPSFTHTPPVLCHSAALFSELLPYMAFLQCVMSLACAATGGEGGVGVSDLAPGCRCGYGLFVLGTISCIPCGVYMRQCKWLDSFNSL